MLLCDLDFTPSNKPALTTLRLIQLCVFELTAPWWVCCVCLYIFPFPLPERCSFHAHSRFCFGLNTWAVKLYCLSQSKGQITGCQTKTILYTDIQQFSLYTITRVRISIRFQQAETRDNQRWGEKPSIRLWWFTLRLFWMSSHADLKYI